MIDYRNTWNGGSNDDDDAIGHTIPVALSLDVVASLLLKFY
jgi:hypothetical protein